MSHTGRCEEFLTTECGGQTFLTPSCTAALELVCMMILEPGDEVILPSWTFPSCANAIILRGAVPVFVDVDSDLNIHTDRIRHAITPKTKAVMAVHYAGVVAHMENILQVANEYGLYVIEDAAQALGNWKISGDFGCLSFHYTKNIECGQGGALVVNNRHFLEKAERMMHCGTDKLKMYRGEQDYYNWLDVGSQYIISEHQAEKLMRQLDKLEEITARRKVVWGLFSEACRAYERASNVGNGHIFWFNRIDKWPYIRKVRETWPGISSHYEALHNTIPGRKYGRAGGIITTAVKAERMLVKVNTGVTEDEAIFACEALWNKNVL